jgi:hypothetical protein
MEIIISPSDFAFLYRQSKWGYYHKYVLGIRRPYFAMPGIFNVIDKKMKNYLKTNDNILISNTDIFNGCKFIYEDAHVHSRPITNPDYPEISITIKGIIDGVYSSEDKNYLVDLKTSFYETEILKNYALQLNSYAFALENPVNEYVNNLNIDKVGILAFVPNNFDGSLKGDMMWFEVTKNTTSFEKYIQNTLIPLFAGPSPDPEEDDPYYIYLKKYIV